MADEITTGPWPGNTQALDSPLSLLNNIALYSQGEWTPTVEGATTAGTGTYTGQSGKWVKVGPLVHIAFTILYTAHTGTGILRIKGLPFILKDENNTNIQIYGVAMAVHPDLTFTENVHLYTQSSGTNATLFTILYDNGTSTLTVANASTTIRGAVTYVTEIA